MARDRLSRVSQLIAQFPEFVAKFESGPPFGKPAQLSSHLKTIALRRALGSASASIANDEFMESLYRTLQAWGIGMRGSNLKPLEQFCEAIRSKTSVFDDLDGIEIDDPSIHPGDLSHRLWSLIESLNIVSNDTPIVPGTKTLHHILPELVVPVDRAYTQRFFGWQNPEFQYGQQKVFGTSFRSFIQIARTVDLKTYVGDGWCSSKTKVIDNAIVGFVNDAKYRN